MSIDVKGKKLLILGGTTSSELVVETAKNMGVYTVVTDMNPESPAKKIADKSYDVSTSEIKQITDIIEKERIDGIFAAYDDQNTTFAAEISKRTGLPFYATMEQIDITKSKIDFKQMCKKHNVPTVKEYNKEEPEFPCVVKPSDSYSAKGISVCRNKEEYSSAVEFALSFSKKKEILVEKYMDCSFVECVNIEYLIMDGEIKLVAVGDKYVLRQGSKAPITASVLYPSIHTEEFANSDVDINTQKMFKSLNMKNGMVYIESFYDEEGFHFYEMGYRLGGGQSSVLMKEVKNADYLQMIINYALTQKMCEKEDFDKIDYKVEKSCCGMVLHLSAGRVEKIIDSIGDDKAIIRKTFFVKEGEEVHRKFVGTLGQTFARIHIVCENRNLLIKKMEEVYEKVKALNKNGENMIVPFEMGLIKR